MSRRKFDYAGYPCASHDLNEDTWYYVQKEGVLVCSRVHGRPSEVTIIPWRKLKQALADHEKAKERKS